jgi:hypothetical protein
MKIHHSNEYSVAKIGVDTVENEPPKVRFICKLRDSSFTDPPHPVPGGTHGPTDRPGPAPHLRDDPFR